MTKYYLCCDLKKNDNIEICYLAYEELEYLLKITSSYYNQNTFVNALCNKNNILKELLKINNKNIFYIKRNINDKEKLNVIYMEDKDLLNCSLTDIYLLLNEKNKQKYDEIKDIYSLISKYVEKTKIRKLIIDNFNEKYDFDKNTDYLKLIKCDLAMKIALVDENIKISLKYIFNNSYNKICFLKELKELLNENLVKEEKYYLDKNNNKINMIEKLIKKNILKYYNDIKKQKFDVTKINPEDYLYRYECLLNSDSISDEQQEDLILYIEEQKKINKKVLYE